MTYCELDTLKEGDSVSVKVNGTRPETGKVFSVKRLGAFVTYEGRYRETAREFFLAGDIQRV